MRLCVLMVFGCLWAAPVLTGCGPESTPEADWIVGIYSTRSAGEVGTQTVVANYEFRADGKVVLTGQDRCGITTLEPEEYAWKAVGDGVEVEFANGRRWRITQGADCNVLDVETLSGGQSLGDSWLARGELCIGPERGCSEGECFCETFYCDAAPAACE